jgi:hypothetical protein
MSSGTLSGAWNARRAAKRIIASGKAPASEFEIQPDADGLFTIHWLVAASETVESAPEAATESEKPLTLAEFVETPQAQANQAGWHNMLEKAQAEGWPNTDPSAGEGSEPTAAGAPETADNTAAIETEIADATAAANPGAPETSPAAPATADSDPELAPFETPRLVAELERRGFRSLPAKRARASATAKEPRRSKNAELDAAAARGIVPEKPDVSSHANHHYQKRFDRLAELAAAGDWDAVAAYECTGVNTYAKMVRQYRDRLLAAQAA